MRVGFITNDQSENFVDMIIVRQMFTELGVHVEEVDIIVLNKIDLLDEAEIGHLKFVITSAGKSMWGNVTHLAGEPSISHEQLCKLSTGTLLVNARLIWKQLFAIRSEIYPNKPVYHLRSTTFNASARPILNRLI